MFKKWRKQRLERRRIKALSFIEGERQGVEQMAERPRKNRDDLNDSLLADLLKEFEKIEAEAKDTSIYDRLGELMSAAEKQGQFRSYLCPREEMWVEGSLAIALMEEWAVPKPIIASLHKLVDDPLQNAITKPELARGVLRSIFEESDSWNDYTSDYTDDMRKYTHLLFWPMLLLVVIALFAFWHTWSLPLGLLMAGAAGSCVSVLSKMPTREVALSGQLDSFGRIVLSRLGSGIIASMIGCGLLVSGVLSIPFHNQSFADLIDASAAPYSLSSAARGIVLLAVPMLFGFSERALATFERTIGGKPSRPKKA